MDLAAPAGVPAMARTVAGALWVRQLRRGCATIAARWSGLSLPIVVRSRAEASGGQGGRRADPTRTLENTAVARRKGAWQSDGQPLSVTAAVYAVAMENEDLKDGTPTARSSIRVIKSDDELTPAALDALRRRSDEELRRLADRANRRG
jgi:hypothetical protein